VPEPPIFEVLPQAEAKPAPQPQPSAQVSPHPLPVQIVPPPSSVVVAPGTPAGGPPLVAIPPATDQIDLLPQKLEGREIRYPEAAKKDGAVGRVEVSFLVTENGEVRDVVVVVSTGSPLDQAVVEAVRSWKYVPARRNGVPIAVRKRYSHEFRNSS